MLRDDLPFTKPFQCLALMPMVAKLPQRPPILAWLTVCPSIICQLLPSFHQTPTSFGGRLGSSAGGVGAAATAGGAMPAFGLIITRMMLSGTWAAFRAFRPSMLVSKA